MNVTLYSKTPCKPCAELKLWFKLKKVQYEEVPLADHIDKISSMGFMSAPVVEINGTYVAGSNISDVRQALEQNGVLVDEQSTMAYA